MGIGRFGVMTSGGDAPGMNAAVRAVFRMANHLGLEAVGIQDGYQGLLNGQLLSVSDQQLDGIERRGGTILGTSRSSEFRTPRGLDRPVAITWRRGSRPVEYPPRPERHEWP